MQQISDVRSRERKCVLWSVVGRPGEGMASRIIPVSNQRVWIIGCSVGVEGSLILKKALLVLRCVQFTPTCFLIKFYKEKVALIMESGSLFKHHLRDTIKCDLFSYDC